MGRIQLNTKSYEEHYLKTNDGIKLALNHFKRNQENVVIIANGWTMSKDSLFIKRTSKLFTKFFDVISFDFRGHGESSGIYTFTAEESKDLDTVINYAKKQYKNIYLIGFSLGGAISIIHTARYKGVNKLIIVSAPHSFEKIHHFMWVIDFFKNPFKKYEFRRWIKVRPNLIIKEKTRPIDVVGEIDVPTLFIAGDLDTITDFEDTKSLFEKAKCEKKFELFENCYHAEDLIHQEKDKFMDVCYEWFNANNRTFA